MINTLRLLTSLSALERFNNDALELRHHSGYLSGFNFNRDLLRAAAANTYLETVGTRSDSIQPAIERHPMSDAITEIGDSLFSRISALSGKSISKNTDPVMIAFDYTHEDFYCNRDGRKVSDSVRLTFLKQIFDHRAGEYYDWCFATNVPDIDLDHIIAKYKFRWRIETILAQNIITG